jgi:hypothetical protein
VNDATILTEAYGVAKAQLIRYSLRLGLRERGKKLAPAPSERAASLGFEIAQRFNERQPQPMQDSRPSRSACSASICSSSRVRHDRDS